MYQTIGEKPLENAQINAQFSTGYIIDSEVLLEKMCFPRFPVRENEKKERKMKRK